LKLSVLIPVYDEVNTISAVLEEVGRVSVEKEIILVDDCSTDGTREFLRERFGEGGGGIKVIYHDANMGKGAAIKTALTYASGDFSIIQDADSEYDPGDYPLLLEAARDQKVDVVFGSRFAMTWRVTSFWHFLVNGFLTLLTNILFGSRLTDMETCYKMIRTDIFKELAIESQRFEIEAEITAKLLKAGHQIVEVPISYKGRSYHEGKKITWKDGVATLITLFRYRVSG